MKSKKVTLLKGEGANQHTLHGEFTIQNHGRRDLKEEFLPLKVKECSYLKHEQPDGSFAEHQTLPIEKGEWVMGKQVEYNPFNSEITQIWD